MVALAQYAVAVAERDRLLTPDDIYVTGRELIKSGISGVSGALIEYGVLKPYVPRIKDGIELPPASIAPDWQTLGVEIADMKFWINLKQSVANLPSPDATGTARQAAIATRRDRVRVLVLSGRR